MKPLTLTSKFTIFKSVSNFNTVFSFLCIAPCIKCYKKLLRIAQSFKKCKRNKTPSSEELSMEKTFPEPQSVVTAQYAPLMNWVVILPRGTVSSAVTALAGWKWPESIRAVDPPGPN